MKINRKKLLELYLKEVDNISEVCDWKTNFTPSDIIDILSDLIENNSDLIDRSDECSNCGSLLSPGAKCFCRNDYHWEDE